MAKITIDIPDDQIMSAMKEAAKSTGMKIKDGITLKDITGEMQSDIENYITNDLEGFFTVGLVNDAYESVVEYGDGE